MALTQAERAKQYRQRKRDESVTQPSQKRDVTEIVTELVTLIPEQPIVKGFDDLPADVQENIIRVSNMRVGNTELNPVKVEEEIERRTAAALHYQERCTTSSADDYEGVMRHEGGEGLDEGLAPNGAGAE